MLASLICTGASCSMWLSAVVANVQHSKRNFRLEPQALWDLALSSFPRWFGRSSNFHHRTPSLEPLAPFQLPRLNLTSQPACPVWTECPVTTLPPISQQTKHL